MGKGAQSRRRTFRPWISASLAPKSPSRPSKQLCRPFISEICLAIKTIRAKVQAGPRSQEVGGPAQGQGRTVQTQGKPRTESLVFQSWGAVRDGRPKAHVQRSFKLR